MPAFRLPSEAEWEYASRGGRDMAKYPWGNPYARNMKGCLLANFKPGRGNYYDERIAEKVTRGGSWKDIAYFIETGTRQFEHKDSARSSIGFRCAMSYIGRSTQSFNF